MPNQHAHSPGHGELFSSGHTHDLRGASKRHLLWCALLIGGYMIIEIVAGLISGSLSLLAHAGHMLTDAFCIGVALVAMNVAEKKATKRHTYGYERYEIMAALVNVLALWLLVGAILLEAFNRTVAHSHEHAPDGAIMVMIGGLGFVVHLAAATILYRSIGHSVNVAGVYQHVRADLLGAAAIAVSGGLIWWNPTGGEWLEIWLDPILGFVLALLILSGTLAIVRRVTRILLEGVPKHVDVHELCRSIEALPGVILIHDIHVWTLSQGSDALTAHVVIGEHVTDREGILDRIKEMVTNQYNIGHMTVQLESSVTRCTEDHHVENLLALADQS
ncbi:MAG: cation diffusion facilitator family transporter [Bacteroidota bacterium]|nr:cation diffusion facilitator family transporter [Bacteroidota bacterium]MDE2646424.1 cation diffusion facilitator family transporter [Bacteroidota bacterium]